jgi:hypothetical protein
MPIAEAGRRTTPNGLQGFRWGMGIPLISFLTSSLGPRGFKLGNRHLCCFGVRTSRQRLCGSVLLDEGWPQSQAPTPFSESLNFAIEARSAVEMGALHEDITRRTKKFRAYLSSRWPSSGGAISRSAITRCYSTRALGTWTERAARSSTFDSRRFYTSSLVRLN